MSQRKNLLNQSASPNILKNYCLLMIILLLWLEQALYQTQKAAIKSVFKVKIMT